MKLFSFTDLFLMKNFTNGLLFELHLGNLKVTNDYKHMSQFCFRVLFRQGNVLSHLKT